MQDTVIKERSADFSCHYFKENLGHSSSLSQIRTAFRKFVHCVREKDTDVRRERQLKRDTDARIQRQQEKRHRSKERKANLKNIDDSVEILGDNTQTPGLRDS